MKNYTITVNGTAYDVAVEEKGSTPGVLLAATTAPTLVAAAPATIVAGGEGKIKITAGAAGKVLTVNVKVGDIVKPGGQVAILEVMKMETPVVTSEGGQVMTVDVSEGQSIEAGVTLLTLN